MNYDNIVLLDVVNQKLNKKAFVWAKILLSWFAWLHTYCQRVKKFFSTQKTHFFNVSHWLLILLSRKSFTSICQKISFITKILIWK